MADVTVSAEDLASGKGAGDENFPVASWLISTRHRPLVMQFYRFARAADDVADHPTASADERLAVLNQMGETLTGTSDTNPLARDLREGLAARKLGVQHGLDLLAAFRLDIEKSRYADWADLMDYCRLSAMPVGRFMLDVHGEDKALWPMSDALCAALQVINHLQDCGDDYRDRDRVYIPADSWQRAGLEPSCLAEAQAPEALLREIRALAGSCEELLAKSKPFAWSVVDRRLGLEIAVIHGLAVSLTQRLLSHDPLSQRVHHQKREAFGVATAAMARQILRRRPVRSARAEG